MMKKETIRMIVLLLLCGVGGMLIGFHAGHLSNGLHIALFVIGIALVSLSLTMIGLLQTVWKRRK